MARRHRWVAVQALVTVVLLTLVLRAVDLGALRTILTGLSLPLYVGSLGVVLAGQVAYAWRWQVLLVATGVRLPFIQVLRQYFVGIFVSNFAPSTVGGDVAKVYYLGHGHGYGTIGASVIVDRLLGVGLLAVVASAALSLSPEAGPRLTAANAASAGVAAAALVLLLVAGVGTGGLARRVTPLGARAVHLAERLQEARLDMAAPLGQPRVVAQAALVVVAYAVAVAAMYVWLLALQNTVVPPFLALLGVVTATTVLSNVPVSLNGLGLREQLHVSLLAPLGVAPELAVAISLLLYAHMLVASVIGWLCWLGQPAVMPTPGDAP